MDKLLKCIKLCLKKIFLYGVWQLPYQNLTIEEVEHFYKNRSYLFV